MHASFIVETGPTARKMQPFTRFWRKISALSLQMAIFRRLNAIFIAFYMPNVVHVVFSVEKAQQHANRKHLLDFDENWSLFLSCWRYIFD